jgi:ferritin
LAEKTISDALNEQIGNEFSASQQYIAAAVYYDDQTLPQLAGFFYRQAIEERNHAMMLVQYLLDTNQEVRIPGIEAPDVKFADIVAPVSMALEQEKRVTEEINELFKLARGNGDFQAEQFLMWFVKEQVEEVSTMTDLLDVVKRAKDDPLHGEEYLARQKVGGQGDDPTAPPAAGGAL